MRWILKLYHKYKCFTQQHNFVTESVPTNNPLAVNIQIRCITAIINTSLTHNTFSIKLCLLSRSYSHFTSFNSFLFISQSLRMARFRSIPENSILSHWFHVLFCSFIFFFRKSSNFLL